MIPTSTGLPPTFNQTIRWEWRLSLFGPTLVPVVVWSLAL